MHCNVTDCVASRRVMLSRASRQHGASSWRVDRKLLSTSLAMCLLAFNNILIPIHMVFTSHNTDIFYIILYFNFLRDI